jgi:hypothetical protein
VEDRPLDEQQPSPAPSAASSMPYRDPNGNVVEDELRLAQNVLLLERGRLLVRLEGGLDRARAVEIARSLP